MGLYCASDIYTDTYGPNTLEQYRRRMHDYEAFVHNIMCAHFFVLSSNDTDPMRAPVSCLSSLLIISAALVMRRYRVVSLHIAACFSPKRCIGRWPERFPFTAPLLPSHSTRMDHPGHRII